ncbi:MAG: hypothetical protein IPM29_07395 [Planctomycetes bacterium]|nr:hypothetical protein [Planctomycetota bacterium]
MTTPGTVIELWISDGTAAGTRIVADSALGPHDSLPAGFARLGDLLLFTADDTVTGRELHAVPLGATGAHVAAPFGRGCGAAIDTRGRPTLGAAFAIDVHTQAGAPVALLVAARPAFATLAQDCVRHVASPIAVGAATAASGGTATFGIPVPGDPTLVGTLMSFQAFAAAGGGPLFGAVAGTPGLEVVVGR